MITLVGLTSMANDVYRLTATDQLTEYHCEQMIVYLHEIRNYIKHHPLEFNDVSALFVQCSFAEVCLLARVNEVCEFNYQNNIHRRYDEKKILR